MDSKTAAEIIDDNKKLSNILSPKDMDDIKDRELIRKGRELITDTNKRLLFVLSSLKEQGQELKVEVTDKTLLVILANLYAEAGWKVRVYTHYKQNDYLSIKYPEVIEHISKSDYENGIKSETEQLEEQRQKFLQEEIKKGIQ